MRWEAGDEKGSGGGGVGELAEGADAARDRGAGRVRAGVGAAGQTGREEVAAQLGRRCYGMEISEQYVQVCLEGWMAFRGKQPILEQTGKTFDEVKRRSEHAKE